LQWRRARSWSVVQLWPDGGTYWRSSSQIAQRPGCFSEGENCDPQVMQMKAGIGIADTKSAALDSAVLDLDRIWINSIRCTS